MFLKLKPEIKQALIKMNFIEKYEALSNKYNSQQIKELDRLLYIEVDEVMETIEDLGYSVSFDKREKFLKIQEVVKEDLIFGIHISFINGKAEFGWVVKHDGEVRLGSPWSIYSRLLIDPKYRIKMPAFRDYDELEELLKESFEMYEEFKAILIKEYLG